MPTEALYRALKQEWGEDSRFANWNDETHSFTLDY